MANGIYEPVEELLMSRYIVGRLPAQHTFVHLRLGQPSGYSRQNMAPRATRQLYLSTLPEADLVTRTLDSAKIYEFGIWYPNKKISQLLTYRELLPDTPGFEDLEDTQIQLRLVTAQDQQGVGAAANKMGIEYEIYPEPQVLSKLAERRGGS